MAPSFIEWPRDQTAFEEATVEFACSADGYPSPGLVWTKDDAPLAADGRTSIGLVRMRIERVRKSDQGRYKCTIDNQVNTLESEATLTVLSSPDATSTPAPTLSPASQRAPFFVQTPPQSLQVSHGRTATLLCRADGHPAPTIVWRRDGHPLRSSARTSLDAGNLTLSNVSDADDGTYECTALNDMGVIVARAQLSVLGRETPPLGRRLVSDGVVLSAVEEARRSVDRAVNETIASLFSRDRTSRLTHSQLVRYNRFPSASARDVARAAEVYERALAVVRRHVENGVQFTLPGNCL